MKTTLNKFQILLIICFQFLIIISPNIQLIDYIEYSDCHRIIQLILLSIVLIESGFRNNTFSFNRNIQFALIAILILACLSAMLSLQPRYATIEITVFIGLYYLSLYIARQFVNDCNNLLKLISYTLWGSILLNSLGFYVGYTTAVAFGTALHWPAPIHGFSSVRIFNQFHLWGIGLLCLPLLAGCLKKQHITLLTLGLALWWAIGIYSASRGELLSWLLGLLLTATLYKKESWSFIRIQLLSISIGFVFYLVFFQLFPNIITQDPSNLVEARTIFRDTVSDRLDLWKVSYVMIKNFPILGVGPMHFYFYTPFSTHPHNSVLQIAAEWGLPVATIIFAILGNAIYCWLQKFSQNQLKTQTNLNKNLSIVLFFTIVSNALYSLVDGVIVTPISQVLMSVTIGLMIGQYIAVSGVPSTSSNKNRGILRQIFAISVLLAMLWSATPELARGLTSNQRHLAIGERAFSMAPNTINPRIWMQQRRIEKDSGTN